MATKFHKWTGTLEYAYNLFVTETHLGKTYYQVAFFPDDKDLVKESGTQLQFDKKTKSFIKPKREVEKMFGKERVVFGPPLVVDKDGKALDDDVRIGNGTKAEITVAIFDTGMGKGTRLESVRILELVPYERAADGEGSGTFLRPKTTRTTVEEGAETVSSTTTIDPSTAQVTPTRAAKPKLPF